MYRRIRLLAWVSFISLACTSCYDPSPAFPVPSWENGIKDLSHAFESIESRLHEIVKDEKYDTSSFSIELTSNTQTLWSHFHTARKQNETRPGDRNVDHNSIYRIASITKVFTTLAVFYAVEAGKMHLDDPISKYVPELAGEIPWNDITLRILASQLSGIPREFAQGDLMNQVSDAIARGLPPPAQEGYPHCDEYHNYIPPCQRKDLLQQLSILKPIFAPNQKSTYSNLNFELLGLALETVLGMNYTQIIDRAIFFPLGMSASTFETPPDTHAVLPRGFNYWDIDGGVQNPTGGIFSSSSDMSKFVRYILTHYNALAKGVNWMMPASWGEGLQNFYGMPFEIFRTEAILPESKRPVTFVTKSGGLPGYYSRIFLMPEYGLGLTVLVGGEADLVDEIQEVATVALVREAEEVIWRDVEETYTGAYTSTDASLNSSIELASSPSTGLVVKSFISNGTDALQSVIAAFFVDSSRPWRAQLMPTLLFKNERAQQGEIWRIQGVHNRTGEKRGVWDEFCTPDVDVLLYAGLPINEVVFWRERGILELPAWKLELKAAGQDLGLIVQ